ncbi:MAG: prealbumin-like fold domain-containing protein [Ruminococcus sp.]
MCKGSNWLPGWQQRCPLSKDAQVATLTTDKAGNASVSGLYPGKYYVKEITSACRLCPG